MSPMLLLTTSGELVTCWYESLRQRACPFGQWFWHHGPSTVAAATPRCKRKRAFGEVCIAWISQLRKTRVFSHLHLWLFPLLCLALYPLLLHFQGNHCSKSHYFGHITALHSTSPCASSCRMVCCQHLQASQLLRLFEKGERRWPYTVSSKLYIYMS